MDGSAPSPPSATRFEMVVRVSSEMSVVESKYFPPSLKVDMRSLLDDKIMFGSDYPSLPYARILKEWQELGYSDTVMEKIMHKNAERFLGL